jgi:FSR family fosmidomycin resistance protein-like MFS transporter
MNTPYLTFFLLWLGHFLVDYMIGVWAIYKTLAGLDIAIAGMIAAASAFAGEGMQLVFGGLSDRGYRKILIALGVMLTTCSTLMGYTQDYAVLFLLFLLTCMGSGAFHPSAAGLVGKLSEKRKGLFMTIFQSGGAFGLATSQLIFVSLYTYLNGNTFFLAVPSFCLVAAVLFFGLGEQPVTAPAGKLIDLRVFMGFFKNRDLRNLYITQMLNQSLSWGIIFLLPDLLLYRQYPEWLTFGGGHLCYILGSAFMIVPCGWLADKVGAKRMIFYAQLIACLLFYFFLSNTFLPPVFLCVLLCLLGASQGVVAPIVLVMGTQLVPSRPGMISAFLMGLVWCIAEGIGQGGGGLMTKLFAENATAKSLAILGVLPLIGLWVVSRLPQNESQKVEVPV